MRVGTLTPTKPAYYDRSPLGQTAVILQSAIAPHGATQRSTYTVPAARLAILETVHLFIARITIAAPAALVDFDVITIMPGPVTAAAPRIVTLSNAAGAEFQVNTSPNAFFPAASQITTQTQDASTGGTCTYIGGLKMTEFSL